MVKILDIKTGSQELEGLNGHVSIDKDNKVIRYDIDRALPIIVVGGLSVEELKGKIAGAELQGQTGLRIAIRGGDTLVLSEFHYDRLKYIARVFEEVKEDMDKIIKKVEEEGFTNFMDIKLN